MRSKQNTKKFGHRQKSKEESAAYYDFIRDQQSRGGTSGEEPNSHLPSDEGTVSGQQPSDTEPISPRPTQKPPYRSSRTALYEFVGEWAIPVIGAILLGLGGFVLWETYDQGKTIVAQKEQLETVEENVDELKDKYDRLNTSVLSTEGVVEQIRFDLQNIFRPR